MNSHGPYTFGGAAGNNVAEVTLNFNSVSDVSQLLMHVKTTNSPPSII